jgi:hypothetical protein
MHSGHQSASILRGVGKVLCPQELKSGGVCE